MRRNKWLFGMMAQLLWCLLFIALHFLPATAHASAMQWLHGEDNAPLWVGEGKPLAKAFQNQVSPLLKGATFVRLGMRWDGPQHISFQVRFSQNGKDWTSWVPMLRVWGEGTVHVSHADPPSGSAKYAQLKMIGEGFPTFLAAELIPHVGPFYQKKKAQSTVKVVPPAPGASSSQAFGLTGPFFARSKWGARPAKCTEKDAIKKRIAIHHTAGPNNDTVAVEVRLRGIQAYHQNSKGWCDIGYHLLISQDGRVWEGRPAETMGANVGYNNKGTLGISFMGTFSTLMPAQKMLCAGAKMIDWAAKTFGIARDRKSVLGHREFPKNSTSCPGAKLFSRLDYMIKQSSSGNCGVAPPIKCDYVQTANLSGNLLNIRGGASSTFKILGTVKEGVCLKVLSKQAGQDVKGEKTWYKISYNGITGWIAGYFAVCSKCRNPPQDTQAPIVTILSPKEGAFLNRASIEVSGTVQDNGIVKQVMVNGKMASLDSNNGFKATILLNLGRQLISAVATDAGGNKGEAKISVAYRPPTKEPVREDSVNEPRRHQDAGAKTEHEPQNPDVTKQSDSSSSKEGRIILDSPNGGSCQQSQDCKKDFICVEQRCVSANSSLKVSGGCGCESGTVEMAWWGWLGLMLWLGFVVRRRPEESR